MRNVQSSSNTSILQIFHSIVVPPWLRAFLQGSFPFWFGEPWCRRFYNPGPCRCPLPAAKNFGRHETNSGETRTAFGHHLTRRGTTAAHHWLWEVRDWCIDHIFLCWCFQFSSLAHSFGNRIQSLFVSLLERARHDERHIHTPASPSLSLLV